MEGCREAAGWFVGCPHMIVKVRLFGLLSVYRGPREFCIEAKTVRDVISHLVDMGADKKLLHNALMFINDQPLTGTRRLGRRLSDGDEIALLSPAGGG